MTAALSIYGLDPADDAAFDGDALINVFSSGKSLESIAMAWLVSEGRIQLTDPVTHYWPEYAAEDKAHQTIADVMRHEAGLAALNQSLDPKDLHRDRLKDNKIGAILAAHPTQYRSDEPSASREYHALSRGWIANEIFRRADVHGRTIGEFFETEIRGPYNADLHIGVATRTWLGLPDYSPSRSESIYCTVPGLLPNLERRTTVSGYYSAACLILPGSR